MKGPNPPEWFDEALALKAEGLADRTIASLLKQKGFKVSHQSVWHWTSPAGILVYRANMRKNGKWQ